MSSPENDNQDPVAPPVTQNADTTGNQDNNTVAAPAADTPKTFTEDEPYETLNGDRVWVKDGKTFRQDHTESVYVTNGDHIDLVRALTELGY